ncbi:hypothetical protein QRD43_21850 [Pelomonas sp. APW6]|uniref:Lipoprotein n=1 Tax=Roseateles subflavus TaxID=3053353 RepID=A0ABT7LNW1_9BURK|nr:hypothetical protein [Pelomonas sp. APW6]MDL5034564.1 hypothetical protein [Pelomonas sp. APW6]
MRLEFDILTNGGGMGWFVKLGLVCAAILTCLGLGACAETEKPEVRRVLSALDGSWLVVVKSACGGVLFESYAKVNGQNDYKKSSEKCRPGIYAGASAAFDGKSILASIYTKHDEIYVLSEIPVAPNGALGDGVMLTTSKNPLRFPVKVGNKYLYLHDISPDARGGQWEVLENGSSIKIPAKGSWRYAYYPAKRSALVVKLNGRGERELVSILGEKDLALERLVIEKKIDWLSCEASGQCVGGGESGERYLIDATMKVTQLAEICTAGTRIETWLNADNFLVRCQDSRGEYKTCSRGGSCAEVVLR